MSPQSTDVDFSGNLVSPDTTLRAAMERMNTTSTAIVLVVDEKRHLLGIAVDGDIRRALIANGDLSQPVSAIMTKRPRTLPFGISEDDLRALANDGTDTWMPVVDGDGVVRGLVNLMRFRRNVRRLPNAAVIMAGGRGERLMPQTANVPKPMMMVGGRPILETLIRILHGYGFERVYLSVNHLAEHIESYFGDGSSMDMHIEYLREDTPLGTAGCLAALVGRETLPLLVMNGDLLTRFNPRAMLDFHEQENALATLALRNYSVEIPFGVVEMDGTRLVGIREKPTHSVAISAGIYVLSPEALKLLPKGRCDMPELFSMVNENAPGRVVCFPITDYWLDIGRPEDLARARADFERNF